MDCSPLDPSKQNAPSEEVDEESSAVKVKTSVSLLQEMCVAFKLGIDY